MSKKISENDKNFFRKLRADAHSLNPVVQIGSQGLSEAVLKEIMVSLKTHNLIKVKISSQSKEDKDAMITKFKESEDFHFVSSIGNVVILYKEKEEDK